MIVVILLGLLVWAVPSLAADWVVGDATGLVQYYHSRPSTKVPPTAVQIPEEQTAAQRAFLAANPDRRKLRVVGGLVVLKDPADIAAIDAADAAAAAEAAAVEAELANNDSCNASSLDDALAKVENQRVQIQAQIDAVTNLANAKDALTFMNTRVTAIDKNIVRCLFAVLKKTGIR